MDVAVAAGLLALGLFEMATDPTSRSRPWTGALIVLWSVPLIWRRRFPLLVLAIMVAALPAASVTGHGGYLSFILAPMLAAYTVGRELDSPATWWGPGLGIAVNSVFFTLATGVGELTDYLTVVVVYGGAWAVGFALRRRERQITELAGESAQLRELQAERQRQAIATERARIARELHDIVSHSISFITIQTQAVRRRLRPEQEAEAADLRVVEAVAREAMAELRRLLGILRADGAPLALAPQPGLDQLPRLVADATAGGAPVELRAVAWCGPGGVPDHPGGAHQRSQACDRGSIGRSGPIRGNLPRGASRR